MDRIFSATKDIQHKEFSISIAFGKHFIQIEYCSLEKDYSIKIEKTPNPNFRFIVIEGL